MKYRIVVVYMMLFFVTLSFISVDAEELAISREQINKSASYASNNENPIKSIIEDIVQLNELAGTLLNDVKYENAIEKYESALKAIEENEVAYEGQLAFKELKVLCYMGLGKANYFLMNYKEAADIYEKLESPDIGAWLRHMKDEEKVGYYLYYGNSLMELGEKKKAEDHYLLLNEAYERLFDPLFFDGESLMKKEEYQKAVDTFEKSLEGRPMNVETYINIAKANTLLGNFDEAESIYDHLINNHTGLLKRLVKFEEASTNSMEVYYTYGRQQREAGDIKGAIEQFEKGIKRAEIYDENSKADYLIAKQKRDLFFELGYSHYLSEDYKQATTAFETLERHINPDGNYRTFYDVTQRITSKEAVDYYLYYAVSLEKLGRNAEASVFLNEANKYFKKYPDDEFLKGESHFTSNDYKNAIMQFEKSIAQRPMNMEACYYIAKAYLAMGNMEQAQNMTDYIITQNISDLDNAYRLKSVIKQMEKDYKKAALEKAGIGKAGIRKVFGITMLLMMLIFRFIIQYNIKEKKLSYLNALDRLYKEIENQKMVEAVTNEAAADMSGFE